MKIIPVYVNARKGTLLDKRGSEINVKKPIFDVNSQFVLKFKVFNTASENFAPPIPFDLKEESNYYFAIDIDYDFGTAPLVESFYNEVVLGNQFAGTSYVDSEVAMLVDTGTPAMISTIGQSQTLSAYMCLWHKYQNDNSLLLHTRISLKNVSDLGD